MEPIQKSVPPHSDQSLKKPAKTPESAFAEFPKSHVWIYRIAFAHNLKYQIRDVDATKRYLHLEFTFFVGHPPPVQR